MSYSQLIEVSKAIGEITAESLWNYIKANPLKLSLSDCEKLLDF